MRKNKDHKICKYGHILPSVLHAGARTYFIVLLGVL